MKPRVLFVDDESRILEALNRMLRPSREDWTAEFAGGGQEALGLMGQSPADIVVTDMRMPGLDGAALLEIVAARWPGTARVVLSGQTDAEAAARAVPHAHRFLTKPCDPAAIREVVERTLNLRALLADPTLQSMISGVGSLPPAPGVYVELGVVLSRNCSGIAEVAAVIERDGALAAKVLQLVNSSFFGQRIEVGGVRQACTLLGTGLIRSLALAHEVFSPRTWSLPHGISLEREQRHALQVALAAQALVESPRDRDSAFTAGLLHDVGKLLIANRYPERYAGILARGSDPASEPWREELETFGVSHAEVGACLLGLWGLPHAIVEAVAYHHQPDRMPGDSGLLHAVHLADTQAREAPPADDGRATTHG